LSTYIEENHIEGSPSLAPGSTWTLHTMMEPRKSSKLPQGPSSSAQDVDILIDAMEEALQDIQENHHHRVKLQAAETKLLNYFEDARDLMQSLLADKDRTRLASLFGGDCERIARIRMVLDSVQFSAMFEDDQRKPLCLRQCLAVETVLSAQLGLSEALSEAKDKQARGEAERESEELHSNIVRANDVLEELGVGGMMQAMEITMPLSSLKTLKNRDELLAGLSARPDTSKVDEKPGFQVGLSKVTGEHLPAGENVRTLAFAVKRPHGDGDAAGSADEDLTVVLRVEGADAEAFSRSLASGVGKVMKFHVSAGAVGSMPTSGEVPVECSFTVEPAAGGLVHGKATSLMFEVSAIPEVACEEFGPEMFTATVYVGSSAARGSASAAGEKVSKLQFFLSPLRKHGQGWSDDLQQALSAVVLAATRQAVPEIAVDEGAVAEDNRAVAEMAAAPAEPPAEEPMMDLPDMPTMVTRPPALGGKPQKPQAPAAPSYASAPPDATVNVRSGGLLAPRGGAVVAAGGSEAVAPSKEAVPEVDDCEGSGGSARRASGAAASRQDDNSHGNVSNSNNGDLKPIQAAHEDTGVDDVVPSQGPQARRASGSATAGGDDGGIPAEEAPPKTSTPVPSSSSVGGQQAPAGGYPGGQAGGPTAASSSSAASRSSSGAAAGSSSAVAASGAEVVAKAAPAKQSVSAAPGSTPAAESGGSASSSTGVAGKVMSPQTKSTAAQAHAAPTSGGGGGTSEESSSMTDIISEDERQALSQSILSGEFKSQAKSLWKEVAKEGGGSTSSSGSTGLDVRNGGLLKFVNKVFDNYALPVITEEQLYTVLRTVERHRYTFTEVECVSFIEMLVVDIYQISGSNWSMIAAVQGGAVADVCARIFRRLDNGLTGKLDWNRGQVRTFIRELAKHFKLAEPSEAQMYALYRTYDSNGSGALDIEECRRMAETLSRAHYGDSSSSTSIIVGESGHAMTLQAPEKGTTSKCKCCGASSQGTAMWHCEVSGTHICVKCAKALMETGSPKVKKLVKAVARPTSTSTHQEASQGRQDQQSQMTSTTSTSVNTSVSTSSHEEYHRHRFSSSAVSAASSSEMHVEHRREVRRVVHQKVVERLVEKVVEVSTTYSSEGVEKSSRVVDQRYVDAPQPHRSSQSPQAQPAVANPAPSVSRSAAGDASRLACRNGCGWSRFEKFPTCCTLCQGPDGPHARDCASKNRRLSAERC